MTRRRATGRRASASASIASASSAAPLKRTPDGPPPAVEPPAEPPRRRSKVGGVREGAGRPPLSQEDKRSVVRTVKLTLDERDRHDAARGDTKWSDWMREAAELAIARGGTR